MHSDVELLVSTGRDVFYAASERGITARLREAGVELLVDTCSYIAPILRRTDGAVMTDSAKWAYLRAGEHWRRRGLRLDCRVHPLGSRGTDRA